MKKYFFIIFPIISSIVFFALVFLSSPYREFRPYSLFSKKIPEKLGMTTKYINERKTILIRDEDAHEKFYIDQIPVTVKDYKKCILSENCLSEHYRYNYTKFWDNIFYSNFPVTFVNWFDARDYCQKAGGDLPTAHQWNIAAGYAFGYEYPWGNSEPNLAKANIDGYYQMLTPAGWLPKGTSPYGILDMTGNVREWVLDEIYADNDNKLLKGGCSNDSFADGKIEAYFDHGPTSSGFNRGFRCIYPAD